MTVIPDIERVLNEFHEAKKPIGYITNTVHACVYTNKAESFVMHVHPHTMRRLCCISPVLAAKVDLYTTTGSNIVHKATITHLDTLPPLHYVLLIILSPVGISWS